MIPLFVIYLMYFVVCFFFFIVIIFHNSHLADALFTHTLADAAIS